MLIIRINKSIPALTKPFATVIVLSKVKQNFQTVVNIIHNLLLLEFIAYVNKTSLKLTKLQIFSIFNESTARFKSILFFYIDSCKL